MILPIWKDRRQSTEYISRCYKRSTDRAQFYLVDVSIDGILYEDDGSEVSILPGMVASIDVLSGKRTILEYFWQPMRKQKPVPLRIGCTTRLKFYINYDFQMR